MRRDDLEPMFEFQSDPESNRLAAVIPRTREDFMALWNRALCDPATVARAILLNGRLVGQIVIFNQDANESVGYWIVRDAWGRGVASRAVGLLLDEVPLRPLHARVARHNAASLRVLERNGFRLVRYQHSAATARFLECEEAFLILE